MHTKKFLTLLLTVTLTGCGGGGDSSGGGGGGGGTTAKLNLNPLIQAPAKIADDADGVMDIQVTNPVSLSSVKAVGATANSGSVSITGLSDQTSKQGNAQVDLVLNSSEQVGADHSCWNGTTGARLKPGESCHQLVAFSGKSGASVQGNLVFGAQSSSGSDASFNIAVDTHFVPEDQTSVDSAVSLSKSANIRPNATTEFTLNNPNNQNINGAYIDLSKVPAEVLDTIDWSTLQGGIYYAKKKRIIVPEIPKSGSQKIAFFVKGTAAKALSKPEVKSQLDNNEFAQTPLIRVGGANIKKRTKPKISSSSKPFDMDKEFVTIAKGENGDIILTVPSYAGTLTFNGIDSTSLPSYITIQPSLDKGQDIQPGKTVNFKVQTQPDATSGEYHFSALFTDPSSENYRVDLTALVDASTKMVADNGGDFIALKTTSKTKPRITYVNLVNKGQYNAHMPKDLSKQFSISGGAMEVVDGKDNSCAGATVAPGDTCQIGIQSNNPDTPIDTFTLNAIAGDSNIKTGKVGIVDLQASPKQADVVMKQALPQQIDANKAGYVSLQITNITSKPLTVSSVHTPANGTWNCGDLQKGAQIGPGKTQTYTCSVTASANVNILGAISVGFNDAEFSYSTPTFNSNFIESAQLKSHLTALKGISFDAGDGIDITLQNQGTTRAQDVVLDLSGIGADLYSHISGEGYNPDNGKLTLTSDLLPGAEKIIHLAFDLSAANVDSLKQAKSDIENNAQTQQISISSNNYATTYPSATVSTDVVNFEPNTLQFSAPGPKYLKIQNPTDQPLSYVLSNLPSGVQIDSPSGTLPANSAKLLTLSADNETSPGDFNVNIKLTDTQNDTYQTQYPVSVASPSLDAYKGYILLNTPHEEGQSTLTNVVLTNSNDGIANNAFSIFGITSPTDAFEVLNPSGGVVSSSDIEVTNSEQGVPITSGVADGGQATIALQVNNHELASGTYKLVSKKAGNMEAGHVVGHIVLNPSYNNFVVKPISSLPEKVLVGHKVKYQAEFTNIKNDPIKVTAVNLPNGAVFDTSTPAVDGNLWDGTKGVTLNPGQKATLRFDLTLQQAQALFKGDLNIEVQDQKTQTSSNDIITTFNTEAVDSNDVMSIGADGFSFAPNTTSILSIRSEKGLNNYYLDLSQMPKSLYKEISSVMLGGEQITLPESPSKIDLGYTFPGQPADIGISLKGTAEAQLSQYYSELIDNSNTHYIAIGAANSNEEYPDIQVNINPITSSASGQLDASHTPTTISFSNKANHTFNLGDTSLDSENLQGVSIVNNGCTGTLAAKQSCDVTVQASDNAYGSSQTGIELNYSDNAGNQFLASAPITVGKSTAQLSVPSPLPIPDEDTSYDIRVTNTGPFTLYAFDGSHIGDYLSMGSMVTGVTFENTGSCASKTQLAKGESCSAVIKLTNQAQATGSPIGITLSANAQGNNLKQDTSSAFSVASAKGSAEVLDKDGQSLSQIDLKSSTKDQVVLQVKNIGKSDLTLDQTAADFSWNASQPSALVKPKVDSSNCDGKTLAPEASCQIIVTGVNQSPLISGPAYGVLHVYSTNGTPITQNMPVEMTMIYQWLEIATGARHTCAINYDHKLYCWGRNDNGQLGTGDNNNYRVPKPVKAGNDGFTPNAVKSVKASYNSTCAITENNQLYCWGYNRYGQLGDGSTTSHNLPAKVQDGSEGFDSDNVNSVAVGQIATCAISDSSHLYCWGSGQRGLLGNNETTNQNTPVQPNNTNGFDANNITNVSVGRYNTCAVDGNSQLYCWGSNNHLQLGFAYHENEDQRQPVKLQSYTSFDSNDIKKVQLTKASIFALDNNGTLFSVGYNGDGILGAGYSPEVTSDTKFYRKIANEIASLSNSGGDYTHNCAIDEQHTLFCWGDGVFGKLGTGNSDDAYFPANVIPGNEGFTIHNVDQVAQGATFTCSLTLLGQAYCWGSNTFGQLGIGNNSDDQYSPVAVNIPLDS
ncbi:RCC1 domain-containing protein [Facilibium subflavum]|uniref:RCC1 domain-containing protein n=1 Tax=Facilibium subflavum TaxID=2219058 RepID=UPI000E650DCB|nr:hypothetical protein [Facilibium subflavum]